VDAVCEDRFCFTNHKTFSEICNIAQYGHHVDWVDSFIIGASGKGVSVYLPADVLPRLAERWTTEVVWLIISS